MHWEWSRKLLLFIVLAFGSWITFVSCNALGLTLHIEIRDRTMDKKILSYTYFHDDTWFLLKVERSLHHSHAYSELMLKIDTPDPGLSLQWFLWLDVAFTCFIFSWKPAIQLCIYLHLFSLQKFFFSILTVARLGIALEGPILKLSFIL